MAEHIADALAADTERIKEGKSRKGFFGFIFSGFEATSEKTPPIDPIERKLDEYDLVILGSPVWAQNMASPVRTFIKDYASAAKQVATFCTVGGYGGEAALKRISDALGTKPIAELLVTEADLKSDDWLGKTGKFIESLGAT